MISHRKHNISTYGLLIFFSLVTLVPFFWIMITSLKNMEDLVCNGPLSLPMVYHWANFYQAWTEGHFSVYYLNSIIITSITAIGVLVSCILASYAFVYLQFKGKQFWFGLIILGLLIPGELTLIPLFQNMKTLGLLNSHAAVYLPQIAGTIPFGIFLLRGFMKDIPVPLIESAKIDGASEFKTLTQIIVPLIMPAIVSLLIFAVIWSWNNFMLPNILLQNDNLRTVPAGLNHFRTRFTMDNTLTSAGSLIVAAPLILIYLVFQRNIIEGMLVGAIKE